MITDFIINLFIKIPYALLSSLPDFSISFDTSYFEKFKSYVSFVGYVLPVSGLLPILVISFSLTVFKFVWALVLRIKSFIPTMGS